MWQVKNVVSDDASEFEEMLNKELKAAGDKIVKIRPYITNAWAFSALVIYTVEK